MFSLSDTKTKGELSFAFVLWWWWVLTVSNRRPTPCKGAALPTELRTLPNWLSIQSIFQCFAWTKLWHSSSLDADGCTCAWIATGARCTCTDSESTETDERYCTAFSERFLNGIDCCLQGTRSCGLRHVGVVRNVLNQFGFVHKKPLGIRFSGMPLVDWTFSGIQGVNMWRCSKAVQLLILAAKRPSTGAACRFCRTRMAKPPAN